MVDILRVDTPSTAFDTSRVKPHATTQQNQLYNVADPGRVPKTQDQNINSDRKPDAGLHLDSNFDKFMQAVKNLSELTETYGEMFFSKLGSQINAGLDANFTEALSKYMKMMEMSADELLSMLQNQTTGAMKFSGPFFDLLRKMVSEGGSNELKNSIVDFLRRYDSLTSGEHILTNVMSNLKNIANSIPFSKASELNSMIARLNLGLANGDNEGNLEILKKEIMPFLSNYVEGSKDFGIARDTMGMLTLNLARYEAGGKEAFVQSFLTLMGFGEMNRSLPGVDIGALLERLLAKTNPSQQLMDQFVHVVQQGAEGAAGPESKAIFQNIMSSMLLNESVYMPLLHLVIPGDIDGRQFFSEIWVDPDDESKQKEEDGGRAVKMFIKFDIKNLGFFEMIVFAQDGKLDMELFYPEGLVAKEKDIAKDIVDIVTRNNFDFRTLALGKCTVPKSISEVFPKIYERRNAVNVII